MAEEVFYKVKKNHYEIKEYAFKDHGICLLYELLQGFAHPLFREYAIRELSDPLSDGITGAVIAIDLKGDGVSMYYNLDENAQNFIMSRQHLLDLIHKWDELSNHDVQEILIRRDGERFEIEEVRSRSLD